MDLKKLKKKINSNVELILTELEIQYEAFGDNIYCKCPVHEGSDNPKAVSLSIDKGIWKCWTRDCQEHYNNDLFGLIRGTLSHKLGEEKTFSDTLKWCCKILNIKNDYYKKEVHNESQHSSFCDIVKILNEKDQSENHQKIDINFNIEYPSEYFMNRGFSRSTLDYFNIGDCKSKGSLYNRAIIPINDDSGENTIGLIARSTKEYINPKFLFYPKGFDKRYCLYNYHRAIKDIERTNTLFIVEGQGDVWRLYEAGVKNVVSIFGKTITKQQENKINKLPITHIVVMTDNDQAGRESKIQIKRQFNRMYKLSFPKIKTKDIGDMKVKELKNVLTTLKDLY